MGDSNNDGVDVDNIIEQLCAVRGARPGRQVNLTENEIKYLCTKSREIFIQQPVLLELEAPIKICGRSCCIDSSVLLVWLTLNFSRWYSRTILWSVKAVWIWRISTHRKLFIFGVFYVITTIPTLANVCLLLIVTAIMLIGESNHLKLFAFC